MRRRIMFRICIILLSWIVATISSRAVGEEHREAKISSAERSQQGWLTHQVESDLQSGKTRIRVLLPTKRIAGKRYPVVYVLPVEAGSERRYGDGMLEISRNALQDKHQAIFVAPSFAELPWYADHPTDPRLQQETYLLREVIPYVEQSYPVERKRSGRLLLGFSKSGWGAWSLLLRHRETFERAFAWDAPLMMQPPGKYGSAKIFGTPENLEKYQITRLLRLRAKELQDAPRLYLAGYGGFREQHAEAIKLLKSLGVSYSTGDDRSRKHDWHSGWVAPAVEQLMRPQPNSSNGPK